MDYQSHDCLTLVMVEGPDPTLGLSHTTGQNVMYDTPFHWSAPIVTDTVVRVNLIVSAGHGRTTVPCSFVPSRPNFRDTGSRGQFWS